MDCLVALLLAMTVEWGRLIYLCRGPHARRYFPPIGCSGDPGPEPGVPIGCPFSPWPTPVFWAAWAAVGDPAGAAVCGWLLFVLFGLVAVDAAPVVVGCE